jgi:hypothetical protein
MSVSLITKLNSHISRINKNAVNKSASMSVSIFAKNLSAIDAYKARDIGQQYYEAAPAKWPKIYDMPPMLHHHCQVVVNFIEKFAHNDQACAKIEQETGVSVAFIINLLWQHDIGKGMAAIKANNHKDTSMQHALTKTIIKNSSDNIHGTEQARKAAVILISQDALGLYLATESIRDASGNKVYTATPRIDLEKAATSLCSSFAKYKKYNPNVSFAQYFKLHEYVLKADATYYPRIIYASFNPQTFEFNRQAQAKIDELYATCKDILANESDPAKDIHKTAGTDSWTVPEKKYPAYKAKNSSMISHYVDEHLLLRDFESWLGKYKDKIKAINGVSVFDLDGTLVPCSGSDMNAKPTAKKIVLTLLEHGIKVWFLSNRSEGRINMDEILDHIPPQYRHLIELKPRKDHDDCDVFKHHKFNEIHQEQPIVLSMGDSMYDMHLYHDPSWHEVCLNTHGFKPKALFTQIGKPGEYKDDCVHMRRNPKTQEIRDNWQKFKKIH